MKRIISLVLIALMVSSLTPGKILAEENGDSGFPNTSGETERITVFNNLTELDECDELPAKFVVKNIGEKGTGVYAVYTYTHSDSEYSSNLGYHPSFSTWQGVSGYYFSNIFYVSLDVSLSIAYGAVSINVAASGSSSGFFVAADSSRLSRPYVYGTVYLDFYRVDIYDAITNQLVSTATQVRFNRTNSELYYSVKYKS